jgi:hypothetical protein
LLETKNIPKGLLILPKNIDSSFLENPSSSFLINGFQLHIPCVKTLIDSIDSDSNSIDFYSHMIDTNGISIIDEDKTLLTVPLLIIIMYSSMLISIAEVRIYIPNLFTVKLYRSFFSNVVPICINQQRLKN